MTFRHKCDTKASLWDDETFGLVLGCSKNGHWKPSRNCFGFFCFFFVANSTFFLVFAFRCRRLDDVALTMRILMVDVVDFFFMAAANHLYPLSRKPLRVIKVAIRATADGGSGRKPWNTWEPSPTWENARKKNSRRKRKQRRNTTEKAERQNRLVAGREKETELIMTTTRADETDDHYISDCACNSLQEKQKKQFITQFLVKHRYCRCRRRRLTFSLTRNGLDDRLHFISGSSIVIVEIVFSFIT